MTTKVIFSVSDINKLIKETLNKKIGGIIKIRGEISGSKIMGGNLFANIKDDMSTMSLIMWGVTDKAINVKNGDLVTATGKIESYIKSGSINFIAHSIESEGIGNLAKEYEDRKLKYSQMGYFDNSKKHTEPSHIDRLGIVTSADGAALQDILYVLNKSNFRGEIYIKNCVVQGSSCPKSVASAINFFQQFETPEGKGLDALLITRGGGSFEDLIGFSDPLILEAVHNSHIFTISAVGHEIDFMLSDFVADVRMPTPSVGAEYISKIHSTYYAPIYNSDIVLQSLRDAIISDLKTKLELLNGIKSRLESPSSYVEMNECFLTNTNNQLVDYIQNELNKRKQHMYQLNQTVNKQGWKNILADGFCMITYKDRPVTSVDMLGELKNQKLKMVLADGEVDIMLDVIQ